MFWLRNKKNKFQLRTLIWRPASHNLLCAGLPHSQCLYDSRCIPCFFQIDHDGNGFIELEELNIALETVGMKIPGWQYRELVADINRADANRDGKLSMDEFRSVRNIFLAHLSRRNNVSFYDHRMSFVCQSVPHH